jgi:hypothetical protein
MRLAYGTFYKKFGIQILPQLISPHHADTKWLSLPMDSVYHYFSVDGSTVGPARDEYVLRDSKHQIPMEHVFQITSFEGKPRPAPGNMNVLIKDYHRTHRNSKLLRDYRISENDHQTPIVVNYGFLAKAFKYSQTTFTTYYRWKNAFATMIDKIDKIAEHSNRQHFVFFSSPKTLPSFMQLNNASIALTQASLKIFNDENSLVLLELWKWLSENRQGSSISDINPAKLHLVNFVYQESGQWFVLNLGRLNSWRAPPPDETQSYEDCFFQSKNKLSTVQISKRLLRMYLFLFQFKTITNNFQVIERPEEVSELPTDDDEEEHDLAENDDDSVEDDVVDLSKPKTQVKDELIDEAEQLLASLSSSSDLDAFDDMSHEDFQIFTAQEDQLIEQELATLEDIAKKQEAEEIKSKSEVKDIMNTHSEATLESSISDHCEQLAVDGLITPGEYAKMARLATNYKTIPSPDGIGVLEDYLKIDPKHLTIDHDNSADIQIVEMDNVLDASMNKSTLQDFDAKYVENVMGKDIAGMVVGVQNANVAVTNYKVTHEEDILGAYQEHVLKITPVEGVPSTLRMKIPHVDSDGVFKSNGVKYRLRKQKGDLPIRKVDANKVALTSYYGKCFITRGRNNSNNYGHWLVETLYAKILNEQNVSIVNVEFADVFDADLISPISYSAIAGKFKSFTAISGGRSIDFNFDHEKYIATFKPEVVASIEKSGNVIIGQSDGQIVYLDKYGALYEDTGKQPELIGKLENFLEIDIGNSPVDYITVGVYGKDIPLGIVLGLKMGLTELVRVLGAKYKVFPTGTRISLDSDEYALQFNDETWVFQRDQQFTSMVLAGFNEYKRNLKQFSVRSFDKRGVYQNLMETSGLKVRFVREIDLMFQMFIDPITKELLVEMKEPTTFKGLLFKATQMLMNDAHPDELDPAYMRVKGYERIAGCVYGELVQSIRAHGSKLSKGNSQIEMNPYAVWTRIVEDPAKTQVHDINPIKNLKETEAVTFAGSGGRNKRSMTKKTRLYHQNDMGTVSESTVDSSDVGINVHLSANPQFTSVRGMSKPFDMKKAGPTALLSTSAMICPFSDKDDQLVQHCEKSNVEFPLIAGTPLELFELQRDSKE